MDLLYKIAIIGLFGVGAQWLAWRRGWPAIALMLAAGVIAGPVLGLVSPEQDFGELLAPIISVAVAIILFEGGLSLDFRELRHAGRSVFRLVVPGVPIAWVLGSLAAHYLAGLSWPVSILFAGILVVTGPTVIGPMLRQINIGPRPRLALKWEGIVNDPIGALLAIFVFGYITVTTEQGSLSELAVWVLFATVVAALIGVASGRAIAYAFPRGWVPEYLKTPLLFSLVVACFAVADAIEHETGLVAVTAMGITLANSHIASIEDIRRFKESVTVLLISGVFVLLSATLDLEVLQALEWRFLLFLVAILFLVRPISVLVSLLGTNMPWNERLFIAWIAPRGIVAIAISGLFALRLTEQGLEDGAALIPLSFAVVFVTIIAHAFSAKWVAARLNIAVTREPGVLLVGASPWSISLAKYLRDLDIPVTVNDTSWTRLSAARLDGIPTFYGELLSEAAEDHLDIQSFRYLIAATGNEAYNALACNAFAPELGRSEVYQLGEASADDPHALPHTIRGNTLFRSGAALDELLRRHYGGWRFQKTKIGEKFTYKDYLAEQAEEAEMLFILKKSGALRFATHANRPTAEVGDLVVAYVPPEAAGRKEEAKAVQRAGQRAEKAREKEKAKAADKAGGTAIADGDAAPALEARSKNGRR